MRKAVLFFVLIVSAGTLFASSLVAYFSATGNTASVAGTLAEITDSELFEIVPADPYTRDDLHYQNDSCRANLEQNDPDARPEIASSLDNIDEYDTIYIGFPIWWGRLPKIMYTFLETYDLSGKTIAPFCTSGGSGISQAVSEIRNLEPEAQHILNGLRTSPRNAARDIPDWIERNI